MSDSYTNIGADQANPTLLDLSDLDVVERAFPDGGEPSTPAILQIGDPCCDGALLIEGTLDELAQIGHQIVVAVLQAKHPELRKAAPA